MRIAVTGAAGFVGRRTCELLLARGHDVRAIVRGTAAVPHGTERCEVRDLSQPGWHAAFDACDAVVHLAARVHVMRESAADPLAAFRAVNVEGSAAAYRAACAAGARRFLFLSSVKVHGEGRAQPYVETDAPAPADPYGVSKLEAERRLTAERAAGGAAEIVILRPPLVYGAGVGGNFRRLLHLADLARRWPLPLGGIRNRRSLVAVQNLADAIGFVLESPVAGGRTLLVSDGDDLSTSALIARLARALGGEARLLPCPQGIVRRVASLAGMQAEVDRLLGTLCVDSSPLRTGLGWTPPQSVDAALDETAEWYREGQAA
jgi:nucleoside-diphosphate-sugar epimerase